MDILNPLNPKCDATQRDISAALDEGIKLPAAVLDHVEHCPDCAAFLDAWSGSLEGILAAPLPHAGPELRDKILAMPAEVARVERIRHRFRAYLSAAAAAVVLGVAGYTLIDVPPVRTTKRATVAKREFAAIKSDFRRGLAALREPASAVQRVLSP